MSWQEGVYYSKDIRKGSYYYDGTELWFYLTSNEYKDKARKWMKLNVGFPHYREKYSDERAIIPVKQLKLFGIPEFDKG